MQTTWFRVGAHVHSRWWLTMQWAASSLSKGTSNKAWWNKSSLAVGRLLGSTSRHFWINSCKHANQERWEVTLISLGEWCACSWGPHPLQWVFQGLNGTVYGFLGHIGGISITLDFQHSHLRERVDKQQSPPCCSPAHLQVIAQVCRGIPA